MTAVWIIIEWLHWGEILEQTYKQHLFLSKLNCAPNCQMLMHAFILGLNKPGALLCIRFQTLNTPWLLLSALSNDICLSGLRWSGWHWFRHVFFFLCPYTYLRTASLGGFRGSVSGGKFGFERHKLDFARAAQSHLTNNHPSVSECGLFARAFGLCILNREWLLQGKKGFKWLLCPTL